MKKTILLTMITALSTTLFAYSDADMDGVADAVDKCPNTPLTDLVDINGCTKKVLIPKSNKHHFDIIVGANYSGSNFTSLNQTDTMSSSLQVDYYYENFSLQASTSYYKTDGDGYSENGMNDSFVGVAYNIKPNKDLLVRVGIGAILPTYDTGLNNNNTDYTGSLNVSYTLGRVNIFGGYIHTMINDDDTTTIVNGTTVNYSYQNTDALSIGAGYYFTDKLYMSASYNSADSIYKNVEDVDTVSLYGYRSIDKNWFLTFFYAYGLSDSASDHAASIKLGYYF
ncbi:MULTISPECIES: DUF3187 domain-containing protein [Sulfurimonas]|uniref:DUF3187 domain-containing protein n=1 Tax=Sulfurimonas TaxID=202746 RepID=UPI0012642202|nr:DUF3187 domain-containing protein [Sulfurimonas indica]